jgi:hypothetical protein
MAIEDLRTRKPVLAAVQEWNRIGARAFRLKHGAVAARRYFLVVGRKPYDLKPILAAAHKVAFPTTRPVRSRDFHTHAARTVAERLDFEVFLSSTAADVEAERRVISETSEFNPQSKADGRTRMVTAIVQRQGQAQFRKRLLTAYSSQCAVSGCAVEPVLDAAHISPYRAPATNHVANGILLRTDLHTLFDLLLITVNPNTMKVEVSPQLRGSEYWKFHGPKLFLPTHEALSPNRQALQEHRRDADTEQTPGRGR